MTSLYPIRTLYPRYINSRLMRLTSCSLSGYKFSWYGSKSNAETAFAILSEVIDPPADAVAIAPESGKPDNWVVEAYFPEGFDGIGAINEFIHKETNLTFGNHEQVPDVDWVAHSLEGLGVVRCGRFILYGSHDKDKLAVNSDDIPIQIEANVAFGTGHHPTTAGCLTLLDRFAGFAPKSVLDLGCGSAVLAIAAAKLWGRHILATDIDEDSVEIAAENAVQNNVEGKVRTISAAGFDHDAIKKSAPFDFIFANILAGPLKELAPEMAAHTSKNGRVMLAGLMREQEDSVAAAYTEAGFRLINRLNHKTWPVLLFVKQ